MLIARGRVLVSVLALLGTRGMAETGARARAEAARASVPRLVGHKGQAGRVGVLGGSLEYTGAPYFAAISALKVGADLVHVFCAQSAAPVIKSYSPELIVHPLLDRERAFEEIKPWLDRLHVLVIGPGLGRDKQIFQVVTDIITECNTRKNPIPLVIDADGLFLITQNTTLLQNHNSINVLTPNKIEFERFQPKIMSSVQSDDGDFRLKHDFSNIFILEKGIEDRFICRETSYQWKSDISGSGRRCGGQGDILSGALAVFLHWSKSKAIEDGIDDVNVKSASTASFAASVLVRKCNEKAFKVKGRSMLAGDMIEQIHEVFEEVFEIK